MEDETFNAGDVVQLKSGGPAMTVADTQSYTPQILCEWFEGAKPQTRAFHAAVLKRYQDPSVGSRPSGSRAGTVF